MVKEIALTRGKVALVNDEDFDFIGQWKWHAVESHGTWYACNNERQKKTRKKLRMHRIIMDAPPRLQVDHVDHDGLNNQRSNLRVCSNQQNRQNGRLHRDNKSGYKGIGQRGRSWRAEIRLNGRTIHLGSYKTRELAAAAYNAAASSYFGEFACLNNLSLR